jgi:hypothetical protein
MRGKMKKFLIILTAAVLSIAGVTSADAVDIGKEINGQTRVQQLGDTGSYEFSTEDKGINGSVTATIPIQSKSTCFLSVVQESRPFSNRFNVNIKGLQLGTCVVTVKDDYPWAKTPVVSFTVQIVKRTDKISTPVGAGVVPASLQMIVGGSFTTVTASGLQSIGSSLTPEVCSITPEKYSTNKFALKAFKVDKCVLKFETSGNETWLPATPVIYTLTVGKAKQVISYSAIPFTYVTLPMNEVVSSSSGLPVTVTAGPATVCLWANNVLTPVGEGKCALSMTQAGDGNYLPVSEFWAFPIKKMDKTIVVKSVSNSMNVGSTQTLNISGSSKLSLVSLSPDNCSLIGLSVTAVKVGACTISVTDPADNGFNAAPPVTISITVTPIASTIKYSGPTSIKLGAGAVNVIFSSNSPATITSVVSDSSICSLSNGFLTALKVGTCVIQSAQPLSGNYTPAALKTTVNINK